MLEFHDLNREREYGMPGRLPSVAWITLVIAAVACPLANGQESESAGHWAFQEIRRPRVPASEHVDGVRTPIDSFIFQKLQEAGVAPRSAADRVTLHRRVSLDLLGLPPTPEEQVRFAGDTASGAWERLVERLLARPEFGERWARHWLDVARYGESNGYERDGTKPNAWRFRDYAIEAFNSDLPFDRFLTEQLAGDEIPGSNARTQIATTFLRLGTWDDEPADPFADRYDQLDDVLGTTVSAFMGLTLRCARCHDHKFEPLTQMDYYGVLAVFTPLKRPEKIKSATHREEFDREVGSAAELAAYRDGTRRADVEMSRLASLQSRLDDSVRIRVLERAASGNDTELAPDVATAFVVDEKARNDKHKALVKQHAETLKRRVFESLTDEERATRSRLVAEISRVTAARPAKPPRAYIWYEDTAKVSATRLFQRGDPYQPRLVVGPAVPAVLRGEKLEPPRPLERSTGRRLWLSRWMTSRSNPLVARVFVNRLWQHLLGEGLVTSESDFGEMGDVPIHQGLLDWLAADLIESGWQIKRLIKHIVMSAVYRMDSQHDASAAKVDPQERLLWRFRQRRLDAEAFRDSVLAISGKLNQSMRGPSIYPELPKAVLAGQSRPGSGWGKPVARAVGRRSVYIFSKRSLAVPELALLDAPNSADSCSQRAVSTTGPQALTFLNGGFMTAAARGFADRLRAEAGAETTAQVHLAFRLALCRSPSREEVRLSATFLRDQATLPSARSARIEDPARRALDALCLVLLNTNEFAYTR